MECKCKPLSLDWAPAKQMLRQKRGRKQFSLRHGTKKQKRGMVRQGKKDNFTASIHELLWGRGPQSCWGHLGGCAEHPFERQGNQDFVSPLPSVMDEDCSWGH